jgi:transcriptional regulator with XRE-family HTH domain
MEKKTIGKFISALRKANGMTQKELGEKLFVSDKTVSRWECDECTPELSLIPSIAEIFGITTDELLRGERNNPERVVIVSEEAVSKQRAKSDKQFKLMLDRSSRKYKNLTLISIGITIFGFIAALIANVGFSKGLIAFCLATAFCVASEICQICFAINARITPDEDDDTYTDKIQEANTGVIKTATTITFVNLLLFAFCLPLVTMINGANYGLVFEYWLDYGLLAAAIAFVLCYIIYTLFVRKVLCERNLISLTEKHQSLITKNNKLLAKTIRSAVSVALALGICIGVWNIIGWQTFLKEYTFDNCADFKEFMESDYNRWFNETYGYANVNGEIVEVYPGDPNHSHNAINHKYVNSSIVNSNGEEICSYYYNPDLYWRIDFTLSADDKMPVTVVTCESVANARDIFFTIETVLYIFIVIDFVIAAIVYIIKANKNNKKA